MSIMHNFHIPIMGIGFTIDTPLKVAKFGINSVASIGDDILLEKLRKKFCENFSRPYKEITSKEFDFRAKRTTAYLNLLKELVSESFEKLKKETFEVGTDLRKYFELLSDNNYIKYKFNQFLKENNKAEKEVLEKELIDSIQCGSIDVNIMTKIDKANVDSDKNPLPKIYNDAHASLRGYANSSLKSSLVLSAGLNPSLYSYIAEFEDFLPNKNGEIIKKVILKVSDYRSAEIQGKFLAKKGIFVSEYRIESGLNCGGHAFATKGMLMGPILEEFKSKRNELARETYEMCVSAWQTNSTIKIPADLKIKISAQGGIGTFAEHDLLIQKYEVDSVGWGTPFLLVPEAVNIDSVTIDLLKKAKEKDLCLSHTSPLGVLFNTLKKNTKDLEKQQLIAKNRPGSSCPKKFLSLNTEFTEQPICTASRQYQDLKIKHLNTLDLPQERLDKEINKVTEKSCICVGLGTPALLVNNMDTRVEGKGVSVCPGPNMAYFDKEVSLKKMVDHIYGRTNIISDKNRPVFFVKELQMYVDYLANEIKDTIQPIAEKKIKYFHEFVENLEAGIAYYKSYIKEFFNDYDETKESVLSSINELEEKLNKQFLSLQVV